MTLADRIAIVTGAGHGTGKVTAPALGQAGAHVVVDIDQAAAEKMAGDVTRLARRSLSDGAEVGDVASIS